MNVPDCLTRGESRDKLLALLGSLTECTEDLLDSVETSLNVVEHVPSYRSLTDISIDAMNVLADIDMVAPMLYELVRIRHA